MSLESSGGVQLLQMKAVKMMSRLEELWATVERRGLQLQTSRMAKDLVHPLKELALASRSRNFRKGEGLETTQEDEGFQDRSPDRDFDERLEDQHPLKARTENEIGELSLLTQGTAGGCWSSLVTQGTAGGCESSLLTQGTAGVKSS